jgi:hypothetical protein
MSDITRVAAFCLEASSLESTERVSLTSCRM